MTKQEWETLRAQLEINERMGVITPVKAPALDEFERIQGVKLPATYRTFCEVFGAGEFAERFKIAVPGYKGKAGTYSLETLNALAHSLEYKDYSSNPDQHERGIFFSLDVKRSYHFFDPQDITDGAGSEYGVYTLFSDFGVERTATNFWEFITVYCLGEKSSQLIKGAKPSQLFLPVNV